MKRNRFILVTVKVPAGSLATQFNLPDVPELRRANVTRIVAYPVGAVPTAPGGNGSFPNVTAAQFANAFLTVYKDGVNAFQNVPLSELNQFQWDNAGNNYAFNREAFDMEPAVIDTLKTFVTVSTAINPAQDSCFVLGFYYQA